MKRTFAISLFVCSLLNVFAVVGSAQDMLQANLSFDQQFWQQLNSMRADNYASQQQLYQNAIQQFGPQMQAGYQQYCAQYGQNISFEQYAYYWIMTAGGTNVQAGLDAQRRNFEGLQQANRTVQEGYASYNNGYWQNQAVLDASAQRYSDAYRGNWNYQNPYTGSTYTLPYSTGEGYYTSGNDTFYVDANGQYYQYNGSGWTQMNMINR